MRLLIHDYAGHPFQVQLSRELARRGHQVTHAFAGGLLTPRGALARRADDPATFESVEVPMSPDYRANKYSFLKRRRYEVEYGQELAKLVSRLEPEVVVSGNTPTEPQWAFGLAARGRSIPMVTWVQDFYSVAVDKLARKKLPLIGALAGWWYRRLDALCFKHSARIVAITEDFRPILGQFGVPAEKVTVIPNWAPLDELPLQPRSNPWSKLHGLEGAFVFHYSGTLAMKHNPDLLRQLALQFRSDPQVRIVVVSEGPGADYLAQHKATEKLDNLLLLPFQPFDVVPEMLAASEVLIAVLEPEAGIFSVPSKVLTYHCAQRPILGAIPEENLAARIIMEQGSGRCVDPRNAQAFVDAAAGLRGQPVQCRQMADRGRAYALREFDLHRIADRFEELFIQARTEPLA
jgi:glycosyltransferase involved in cell wall biosynthesis